MKKTFFILIAIIIFQIIVSLSLISKGRKKANYIIEFTKSLLIFYTLYHLQYELKHIICFVILEYIINKLFVLFIIILLKQIAFRLLISTTQNGIISKIIFCIFNKKKTLKLLRMLRKIDYGPRLKQGIPAMVNKTYKRIKFDRNGFPKFNSFYNFKLLPWHYRKTRDYHFYKANKAIYIKALKSKKVRKLFTRQDMQKLKSGQTPDKYTWHHHQNRGKLQLVSRKVHASINHIGGYSIWGKKE